MLAKLDLTKTIDHKEFNSAIKKLKKQAAYLQREIIRLGIPVILVFEGWGASGKGTLINELIQPLDPRGFKVYTIKRSSEEEDMRPFLWRYWTKTPAKGKITIFDRSWYRKMLIDRIEGNNNIEKVKNTINSFERQLTDDGTVIIKIFLHISEDEQRKRFKELETNPKTSWRVTKDDWKNNRLYNDYLKITDDMIKSTNSSYAPWTLIEAHNQEFAISKVFSTVISVLEKKVNSKTNDDILASFTGPKGPKESKVSKESKESKEFEDYKKSIESIEKEATDSSLLSGIEMDKKVSSDEYNKKLKKYQSRLREIQHEIYTKRVPMIIVFEGWDAAGKGGNIKRITKNLDPRGYEVIPVAAPSEIELNHHYLWRFWNQMPKAGHIAIFDRSWYGRVMVERVEGFCTSKEWQRAYNEINEMERHITDFGAVIIKFWLHIDSQEQLKRFNARLEDPDKEWKITQEDWRNRDKWDEYLGAVDEMLLKTSTPYAPWTVVEANYKPYARLKTLKTIINVLEEKL